MGVTLCLATLPPLFFLIRLFKKKGQLGCFFCVCDLYRLAGFLLVERFWDVAK